MASGRGALKDLANDQKDVGLLSDHQLGLRARCVQRARVGRSDLRTPGSGGFWYVVNVGVRWKPGNDPVGAFLWQSGPVETTLLRHVRWPELAAELLVEIGGRMAIGIRCNLEQHLALVADDHREGDESIDSVDCHGGYDVCIPARYL